MNTYIPATDGIGLSYLQPITTCKVRPAILLDFDGTIRRSKSGKTFITNPDDIEIISGVEERIWHFKNKEYLVIGISNQGGVAFGYKKTYDIKNEMERTLSLFRKNPFDLVLWSYSMQDGSVEPYNHRSLLRKPEIGMLALAENMTYNRGHIIDWDNSFFVGDRNEDKECAEKAAITYMDINEFLQLPMEEAALPITLQEAIEYMLPRFAGCNEWEQFKKGEDSFAAFCHSQLSGGIGMKIRNELGFWTKDTVLYNHMKDVQKLDHADAMSDVIIRGVYRKLADPKSKTIDNATQVRQPIKGFRG